MITEELMYTLAAHINLELCDAGKKVMDMDIFFVDNGEYHIIEGDIAWDFDGILFKIDLTFSDENGELFVMSEEQEQFLCDNTRNYTE
jgi:hypothetical protein